MLWSIYLENDLDNNDHCTTYLKTRFWSETAQEARLEMGCADTFKAWLNGKVIVDNWKADDATHLEFSLKVKFEEGWNELMVKFSNLEKVWSFGCRVNKQKIKREKREISDSFEDLRQDDLRLPLAFQDAS
ncbi:MAG: hypothetical protein MI725_15160 [Pirellulales bacterium]|nr:hypothetical protein [Pirellulales bacterium]